MAGLIASAITALGGGYTTYWTNHVKEVQMRLDAHAKTTELKMDTFEKICLPILSKSEDKNDEYTVCKREQEILIDKSDYE